MPYNQFGGADRTLIILIVGVVLFFFVILPCIENFYNEDKKNLLEKLENVMDSYKLDKNKCSRSCCINTGWALPEELRPKDMTEEELKKYVPTNLSCNFGSNTGGGCLCVTKDNYDFLGARGKNAIGTCGN